MKTKNAVEILKHRMNKRKSLKRAYEEEKFNFQIACLIRQAREKAGITQSQLASLIGTRQSVISRLEDADYEGHSLSILQKIAKALNKALILDFKENHIT
ncbi:MAG: helix-turn-helix transcriptional regulator [Deltaproteobacteria bacterium]|nr:helix-turn-helix transcriptional regulator [Deltaproteobacteria bacterium]